MKCFYLERETAALHLFDIADEVSQIWHRLPAEDPARDVWWSFKEMCEKRARALVLGENDRVVSESAHREVQRLKNPPPARTNKELAAVRMMFKEMISERPLPSAPPLPSYPRLFSWARYTDLDGCYTQEDGAAFDGMEGPSLEGRVASEIMALDILHGHFIVTMLTELECDVVAGVLLNEICHLVPDKFPGYTGDTPTRDDTPAEFATYAWASWRNSAARNRRRQIAVGVPERTCVTSPLSRQMALGHLAVNVRRTRIRLIDGFGDDSSCTNEGYSEWARIDDLFCRTLLATLSQGFCTACQAQKLIDDITASVTPKKPEPAQGGERA